MYKLARKTLEIYIREKRIITLPDFPPELLAHMGTKEAVFVTLYYQGKVIASTGRITCKKENTLYECIDNTLLALKDPRFLEIIQTPEKLAEISIRTDRFSPENRRILQTIDDINITNEGIIFLSQNFGVLSVILPHMVNIENTPAKYFSLACQKAGLDEKKISSSDYVIYWLTTMSESEFDN